MRKPKEPSYSRFDYEKVELYEGITVREILDLIKNLPEHSCLSVDVNQDYYGDEYNTDIYISYLSEGTLEKMGKLQAEYLQKLKEYEDWYISSGKKKEDDDKQAAIKLKQKERKEKAKVREIAELEKRLKKLKS